MGTTTCTNSQTAAACSVLNTRHPFITVRSATMRVPATLLTCTRWHPLSSAAQSRWQPSYCVRVAKFHDELILQGTSFQMLYPCNQQMNLSTVLAHLKMPGTRLWLAGFH